MSSAAHLEVQDLSVRVRRHDRYVQVVERLSYSVRPGQTLAIIGASGSGKTLSCRALIGLLPATAHVSGSVRLCGTELVGLSERALRPHRGRGIAMIFQDATRSLNPTVRIGEQITEVLRQHHRLHRAAARQRALELLDLLQLPAAPERLRSYPHELSGGMLQRVIIAIALAANPKVLIADEATRSLDAITQRRTLALLKEVQQHLGTALVMVSHDLRLAMSFADEAIVMRAGATVEHATPGALAKLSRVPYTRALFDTIPPPDSPAVATGRLERKDHTLLVAREIVQEFPVRAHGVLRNVVRAVSGVSFEVRTQETLGIVGESGSGKTTLARALVQAPRPTSGSVHFVGADLTTLRGRTLIERRRRLQMIFQDASGSLNPSWRVADIVAEPLVGHDAGARAERTRRIGKALELVGMPVSAYGRRRPTELSGGECQRVAIARALTVEPSLLICDEAVSALDALIQSQLLALFRELQAELRLSYLFISHDLAVVRQISDRVAVLYLGRICEIGPTESIYRQPLHPYTAALLATARGDEPAPAPARLPMHPLEGCAYRARCLRVQDRCAKEAPALRSEPDGHAVACHFPRVTPTSADSTPRSTGSAASSPTSSTPPQPPPPRS